MKYIQVASVIFLSLQRLASAFPTQAGSCVEGPAVGGFHLSRPQTTGSLSDGGFEVLLNDVPLDIISIGSFPLGENATLTLRSTGPTGFLGYLLRLDLGDGDTMALIPDSSGQVLNLCSAERVSSSTHTNSEPKSFITAVLETDVFTALSLDVTVVVRNIRSSSVYYHTKFLIQQANPGFPSCPACGEGLFVTFGAGEVSYPGQPLFTCSQVAVAGIEGFVDPEVCEGVPDLMGNCGCSSELGPTNPPNPGFPPCEVCGEGNAIGNPSGEVSIPSQPLFTCATVAEAGLLGFIDPDICPFMITFLGNCDCSNQAPVTPAPSPPPTSMPVTSMPVMPDTPAPVTSCGVRNDPCLSGRDCCSGSCHKRPGITGGQCLSSKSSSKADQKLGGGMGGAGAQAKR